MEHDFRRRLVRLAVPATAAILITGSVVGVAVGGPGSDDQAAARSAASPSPLKVDLDADDSPYLAARIGSFSRSAKRVTLAEKPEVEDREYMTAPLNVWPTPAEKGKPLTVLDEGDTVALTGEVVKGWAQILLDGQVRWVNAEYLSDEKPKPPEEEEDEVTAEGGGISSAPCGVSSSIESGIVSSAVTVYRAVCAQFPQVTSYGGYRGDGEHADGHAIDIMVSDYDTGQAIADWLLANAGTFGLDDIIWYRQIWTLERSSEGWRALEDRGSPTANHEDHVHVRVQ